MGTRHRAGIGLSENYDATVLIVSEETGTMSMARGGVLRRPLNEKDLRKILEEIYKPDASWILNIWNRLKKDRKETAQA